MKLNTAKCAILVGALITTDNRIYSQGFINLNFESANIPGSTEVGSLVPISAGLPGWSGYYISSASTDQETQVAYDGISIGGAVISILDINAAQYGPNFNPIEGRYSAALFGEGGVPVSTMISQTGLVPGGTMSLRAKWWSTVDPVVTLGGQTVNMVPLETFPTYTLYGGDISSFAGKVVTLSFTEPPPAQGSPSMLVLDNILFSNQAVPEAGVFGLWALGAWMVGGRVVRRRR